MTKHESHDMTADFRELGDGVYLDVQKLIDSRLLVQANSGGGKSYAVRKICEIAYGHAQIIILDPDGEFHTLREKFDFALAGPEGEAPATVETAAKTALTLLELGTSCVIDIYELGAKRAVFIARFIEAIMQAPRTLWHDLILVVDEASKFCTEGGKRDKATEESSNAIIDLMTRGRKRGFCGVLATQRLADLSKSAAAECNTTLIGRCNLDVDIDRAAKRIGMKPVQANEVLPELGAGEFYAMGPAITNDWSPHRVTKIKVGIVVTTHPKRGQKVPVTPPRATVKKVLARLKEIPDDAAAEAKTVDELRSLVQKLTADLAKASKGVETVSPTAVRDLTIKLENVRAQWEQMKRDRDSVVIERDNVKARLQALSAAFKHIPTELSKIGERMASAFGTDAQLLAKSMGYPRTAEPSNGAETAAKANGTHVREPLNGSTAASTEADVGDRHQRLLDTIFMVSMHGLPETREVVAAWYGRHPADHGFRKYLSDLRTQGLVDGYGLTDKGRQASKQPVSLTPSEIYARLIEPLPPRVRRMMDTIIGARRPLSRVELAALMECHPADHGFRKYLSTLRARYLVTAKFPVTPTEVWKVS